VLVAVVHSSYEDGRDSGGTAQQYPERGQNLEGRQGSANSKNISYSQGLQSGGVSAAKHFLISLDYSLLSYLISILFFCMCTEHWKT
jgi:hypothetical protein